MAEYIEVANDKLGISPNGWKLDEFADEWVLSGYDTDAKPSFIWEADKHVWVRWKKYLKLWAEFGTEKKILVEGELFLTYDFVDFVHIDPIKEIADVLFSDQIIKKLKWCFQVTVGQWFDLPVEIPDHMRQPLINLGAVIDMTKIKPTRKAFKYLVERGYPMKLTAEKRGKVKLTGKNALWAISRFVDEGPSDCILRLKPWIEQTLNRSLNDFDFKQLAIEGEAMIGETRTTRRRRRAEL